jgi:5'-phosphate synthase pdxT subunit
VKVGVLALQGDFEAHFVALRQAAEEAGMSLDLLEVRRCDQVSGLDGLILPGGETTTLLNLMNDEPWFDTLREFHRVGGAVLATCAGAILVARKVTGPLQESLGLLDAEIERNGFGRQVDSFETELPVNIPGGIMSAVFIRAPRFRRLGNQVEVLGSWNKEAVLVREGNVVACTFHPELTGDGRLHRFFLDMMVENRSTKRIEATG